MRLKNSQEDPKNKDEPVIGARPRFDLDYLRYYLEVMPLT